MHLISLLINVLLHACHIRLRRILIIHPVVVPGEGLADQVWHHHMRGVDVLHSHLALLLIRSHHWERVLDDIECRRTWWIIMLHLLLLFLLANFRVAFVEMVRALGGLSDGILIRHFDIFDRSIVDTLLVLLLHHDIAIVTSIVRRHGFSLPNHA